MFSSKKTKLLLGALTVLVSLSLSVSPVLADGNVLRSLDAPVVIQSPQATYFPTGLAFDGTNLYYAQPAAIPGDIFHITATGTLLSTLSTVNEAASLA